MLPPSPYRCIIVKTFIIRFLVQTKIKNHIAIYISKANPFRGDIHTHVGMLCDNLLLRQGSEGLLCWC